VASKRFDGNYANMYFFYNYDIRGSVTSIIKPDGSLVKGYDYDEFGKIKDSGDSLFKNDIKFTGAVHDVSSNLYYMNARFYNPNTGRFLTEDTYAGNPYESWIQHLYSYTSNNSINYIDPTGYRAFSVTDDVGGTSKELEMDFVRESKLTKTANEVGRLMK
jgi:RHS repeat-associated protein